MGGGPQTNPEGAPREQWKTALGQRQVAQSADRLGQRALAREPDAAPAGIHALAVAEADDPKVVGAQTLEQRGAGHGHGHIDNAHGWSGGGAASSSARS